MSIGAIIPFKNEEGNVESIVKGASSLKDLEQIIFINGDSSDNTLNKLLECVDNYGDSRMKVLEQAVPFGKFAAIKQSMAHLTTKHILIWDGDNTILFDQIKHLLDIYLRDSNKSKIFLVANRINSSREKNSFKLLNLFGNKIFSILMSCILRKTLPDVLSGAKVFPREIYELAKECDKAFKLDRFGDLILLSNGRKLNLEFKSFDCIYAKRTYGRSNIKRWSAGVSMVHLILHLYLHKCYKS